MIDTELRASGAGGQWGQRVLKDNPSLLTWKRIGRNIVYACAAKGA